MHFAGSFVMGLLRARKVLIAGVVLFLTIQAPAPAFALSFPDTSQHWAREPVSLLASAGIVRGYPDGGFRPGRTVTRAEVAQMLIAALGRANETDAVRGRLRPFSDVPATHWASGAIALAREYGFVEGDASGRYRPEQPVNRLELTVILVRALDWPTPAQTVRVPFLDRGAVPEWGRAALYSASQRGLVAGYEDGTFRPGAPVTRAEAAALIMRFMERRGTLYTMSGELREPVNGSLRLSTAGGPVALRLPTAANLEVYRNGRSVTTAALRPLDWVGVVYDRQEDQIVVRARYEDLAGRVEAVDPGAGVLRVQADGQVSEARLAPGARIYLNGRKTGLTGLRAGDEVYLVWAVAGSTVRAIDAVRVDLSGVVIRVEPQAREVVVQTSDGGRERLTVAAGAGVYRHGESAALDAIQAGDRIGAARDEAGSVQYLEIWE